jgi:hypothetical protein
MSRTSGCIIHFLTTLYGHPTSRNLTGIAMNVEWKPLHSSFRCSKLDTSSQTQITFPRACMPTLNAPCISKVAAKGGGSVCTESMGQITEMWCGRAHCGWVCDERLGQMPSRKRVVRFESNLVGPLCTNHSALLICITNLSG